MVNDAQHYDMIIIGAGISGLSVAHYCASRGLKFLLLERESRFGGCIHSHRLEDHEGFWIELGAHSCFNSYANLLEILEQRGLLAKVAAKQRLRFKILCEGRLRSIFSQLSVLELAGSMPRMLFVRRTGRTVSSYFGEVFGRRNFRSLLAPALDAVVCQDSSEFPAELLFKRKPRRKDLPRGFTFPAGLQEIADSFAMGRDSALQGDAAVESIAFDDDRFMVSDSQGRRHLGRCVVVATPVGDAAKLLRRSFPDVSGILTRIPIAQVETVGVVVRKTECTLKPLGGIIARGEAFYSVVSRDALVDPKYRGFTFHFRPGRLDWDAKIDTIVRVLGVRREQLLASVQKTNRLPVLGVDQGRLVGEIDNALTQRLLGLVGNYFTGLSLEDCVRRARAEFTRLSQRL